MFCFFFQAEDGIRDGTVTGVQTCALPIWSGSGRRSPVVDELYRLVSVTGRLFPGPGRYLRFWLSALLIASCNIRSSCALAVPWPRSEERRVGKECRSRWAA